MIVGDPIAQVRSPQELNAAFAQRGINAVMLPMHVAPPDLASAVTGLRAVRNLAGVVVTVPHKEAILPLCDRVDPRALAIGSANAVRVAGGRWEADNFDGTGFVDGLVARAFPLEGAAVFVAGLGGAGRSVAFALAERKASRVALWDIDEARRASLVTRLRAHFPEVAFELRAAPASDDALIVNCSPLGMQDHDPLPFDPGALHAGQLVADIVMQPEDTRLLGDARTRGCDTHAGKWMLHCQIETFIRFFGLESNPRPA